MVAFVLHDDCGQVVGVGQIAHGAEGDVHVLVDVVVTVLDLVLEDADDLIRDAVDADLLSDGVLAGEKFLFRVGADYGYAGVGEVVCLAEEGAFGDVHAAHGAVGGVDSADAVGGAAGAVGGEALLGHFRGDVLQQWDFGADVIEVVYGEADLSSCFRASGLEFGASGKDED